MQLYICFCMQLMFLYAEEQVKNVFTPPPFEQDLL